MRRSDGVATRAPNSAEKPSNKSLKSDFESWLALGQLSFEKCELAQAQKATRRALEIAKEMDSPKRIVEALVLLLRFASETRSETDIKRWREELTLLTNQAPGRVPSEVWYCEGALATHEQKWSRAQEFFHRYLRELRLEKRPDRDRQEGEAKALLMLSNALLQRGHLERARFVAEIVRGRYELSEISKLSGTSSLILGLISEKQKNLGEALKFFREAHARFLSEHNWYYHLYALLGYARIARQKQDYQQAYFYLDLIANATQDDDFGILKQEVSREKLLLESDAVDLIVDHAKGSVRTRESGEILLKKQYVLLDILHELSRAHTSARREEEKGLSKAQIIERVWKESYRPEAHDNKLYYNINRLRKLIEPNFRQPRYLLNWKEGYRLAPGLRVHSINDDESERRYQWEGK